MSISLQALETALSEIESLGHDEMTFPVGKTPVTMRTLSPEEEAAVQKYAALAWTDNDENASGETLEFVDRFRVDTLARAIIQVGDQDLRGVDTIETGQVLDNKVRVREAKHIVLRGFVHKWGGSIRTAVFKKYTELLKRVEDKADEAVDYEPSDIDTEIERLEKRLEGLKEQKELDEPRHTNPAHAVAEYGAMDQEDRKGALEKHAGLEPTPKATPEPALQEAPAPQEPPSPALGPAHTVDRSGSRQPISPQVAPPPQEAPASQEPPAASSPEEPAQDGGSFVAPDDMAIAAAQENARMFAARQAAGGNPLYPNAESVLSAVHEARQVPPHVAAAQAAEAFQEEEEEERGRQAELRGKTPEGIEVYGLPGEPVDLTPASHAKPPSPAPARPGAGTQNPRFRSSKGGH